MNYEVKYGVWSETINAFWCGGNNTEYIAWKGSHQIFIYPCDEHPQPPCGVIQHTNRIETAEEFDKAMDNGIRFDAEYNEVGQGAW